MSTFNEVQWSRINKGRINYKVTERLAKKMLAYKKLIESTRPLPISSPSLFKLALIEIQAHNNLYSITMQFHWRLDDAIFAVMWIGNIEEMYIISYYPKLSNET